MRIRKYTEFIKEEIMNDTPEQYVDTCLKQIKFKIDKIFSESEREEDEAPKGNVPDKKPKNKSIDQAKSDSRKKESMTLKDLGVRLESSEISTYSKMYDNLTVKFSDDNSTYNLLISIDIKDAIPKDKGKDFSTDDIEKCYVKFKKYDIQSFEVIGQLTKNVKIKDIDEDFLINLKIELDKKFGDESEEEFEIET